MGAYGDSSLWYLIAEANGLSGNSDLRVGQTLSIPNRVTAQSNNASTFKPYDPSRVVGDTSPNLPQPPASGGGGCGGLGQILMVVVAVVVAVYSAGALSGAAGGFAQTMSAGMSVMTGGAVGGTAGLAAATSSTLGVIGTAAAAGAIGSVASQLVGNALGVQQGFSWQNVALSAIGSGIGAGMASMGMGSGPLSGQGLGATVARVAVGNAMSQGIGVVTGLQPSFDWRGVAASAIGASVSYGVGSALKGVDLNQYVKAGIGSFAASVAATAVRGGRVVVQQVAVDALGNALGGAFVDNMGRPGEQEDRLGSFINEQMSAQDQHDISGAQAAFRASEIAYQNETTPAYMGGAGGLRLGGGQGMRFSDGALNDCRNGVDGGIALTAQRDADIDAALAAQQAQARQAQTARAAAATTAVNVGTSQEQAGAVYMAYGGRAARNTDSTAVGADRWRNYDDPVDLLGKPMDFSRQQGFADNALFGGTAGVAASLGKMAVGAARIAGNTITQVGDILTGGINHNHPVMQQVWAEQSAVGASIVNAVTSPSETTTNAIESVVNRYNSAMAQGNEFDRSYGLGELFNDVGQGVVGAGSAIRGVARFGAAYIGEDTFVGSTGGRVGGSGQQGAVTVDMLTGGLLTEEKLGFGKVGPTNLTEMYRVRPAYEVAALRTEFNTLKPSFMQEFAASPEAAARMASGEFTSAQISDMAEGILPKDYTVHQKLPLWRGGGNDFNNFDLMTTVYHEANRFDLHYYPPGNNLYGLDFSH